MNKLAGLVSITAIHCLIHAASAAAATKASVPANPCTDFSGSYVLSSCSVGTSDSQPVSISQQACGLLLVSTSPGTPFAMTIIPDGTNTQTFNYPDTPGVSKDNHATIVTISKW